MHYGHLRFIGRLTNETLTLSERIYRMRTSVRMSQTNWAELAETRYELRKRLEARYGASRGW